jgi:uncharacterized protein (TIGR01244 family)
MAQFRRITDQLAVAGQITPADVAEAARQGFRTIVNNRPDGEEPGQPTEAEIRQAAEALGLAYAFIPIRGMPTPEQVDEERRFLEGVEGPALAFCRSGNRSIIAWSIGEAEAGGTSPDDLKRLAAQHGYDLSRVL